MNTDPGAILKQYPLVQGVQSIKPLDRGHIHHTFLVNASSPFILQRINTSVFPDVKRLMENIAVVLSHLEAKGEAYQLQFKQLQRTGEGQLFYRDEAGHHWRLYTYISDSYVHDKPENEDMAREGGWALGCFTSAMADLDPASLHVLLPRFHDLEWRWQAFETARDSAASEIARSCSYEMKTLAYFYPQVMAYYEGMKQAGLPRRVTHNDTKFNNFLFDRQGKAMGVIDLDTVMPGLIPFDFGDAIRTLANTASEDERDTCQVRFNIRLFQHFAEGYFQACRSMLSPGETGHLGQAPLYHCFLQATRFLTDYLQGNLYYPCHYPAHNLDRTAVQLTLLKDMEAKSSKMQSIIQSLSS